jgi:aminoglycoside 3-N-acetyltransferase
MGNDKPVLVQYSSGIARRIAIKCPWIVTVRDKIRSVARRGKIFYIKSISKEYLSQKDIVRDLQRCGLKPGDKIMVHSSMHSMGILENGPETFVNALQEVISFEGLIVMPTFTHSNMYEYLESDTVFDLTMIPSRNGAITEFFRTQENTYRSLNPTHPVAAWGKDAAEFCAGHEKSLTPFDEHSPYKKMIDGNFKMVLVGVGLRPMTICRAFEDLRPDLATRYPYYLDKIYTVYVKDRGRNLIQVQTKCRDPKYSIRVFNAYLYDYLQDKMTICNIGNATCHILYAQDVFNMQIELAKQGIFGYRDS